MAACLIEISLIRYLEHRLVAHMPYMTAAVAVIRQVSNDACSEDLARLRANVRGLIEFIVDEGALCLPLPELPDSDIEVIFSDLDKLFARTEAGSFMRLVASIVSRVAAVSCMSKLEGESFFVHFEAPSYGSMDLPVCSLLTDYMSLAVRRFLGARALASCNKQVLYDAWGAVSYGVCSQSNYRDVEVLLASVPDRVVTFRDVVKATLKDH